MRLYTFSIRLHHEYKCKIHLCLKWILPLPHCANIHPELSIILTNCLSVWGKVDTCMINLLKGREEIESLLAKC